MRWGRVVGLLMGAIGGWNSASIAQLPAPMALDSAYFEASLRSSGWGLDDEEKDEGWIAAIGFDGDSIRTMMLNFALGGGDAHCTYTYKLRDNYAAIKLGDCVEQSRKATFWFFLADAKTMFVAIPRKTKATHPRDIPQEDWYRFEWIDLSFEPEFAPD